jgi:hypothetical protein
MADETGTTTDHRRRALPYQHMLRARRPSDVFLREAHATQRPATDDPLRRRRSSS